MKKYILREGKLEREVSLQEYLNVQRNAGITLKLAADYFRGAGLCGYIKQLNKSK